MEIGDIAEQVASELLKTQPRLSAESRPKRDMVILPLFAQDGPGAALLSAIMSDPSFGDLRHGWMQLSSGFGIQIHGSTLARRLVDGIVLGESAGSVIEQARAFAACPISSTDSYTPISGATLSQVVDLDPSIELIPWAEVPDDDPKSVFDENQLSAIPVLIAIPFRATANMAVRIRSAETQTLFSSSEQAREFEEARTAEIMEAHEKISDIIRLMTAESQNCVAELGQWSRLNNDFANKLFGIGFSYNGNLFDIAVSNASQHPVAMEQESVARLFRSFGEFDEEGKSSLRVSLDRLNQSLRRPNQVDKAIDLAIALEIILLHSIDPTARGELRYRSSVRGAMFLGQNKQERQEIFKLLRDAYDLRSRAVHAGVLTTKRNATLPEDVLKCVTDICARILCKLIELGSFPNWDVDYVIGD